MGHRRGALSGGIGGAPGGVGVHALGGAEHTVDTLANLNSKVSDANLDDASDPRPPLAHTQNASTILAGTFDPGAFSFLGSTIPALDSLITDNIKIDGNTISSLAGDITLSPTDSVEILLAGTAIGLKIINSTDTAAIILDGDSAGPTDGIGSIEFRDKGGSRGSLKWNSAKGVHFDQGGVNQDYTFDTATQPSIVLWKSNCVTGTIFADVSKVEFFGLAKFDPLGELTLPTLSVTSDAVISGNLTVSGSAFEQFSGEVNVADNHFFMNAGYTAVVAQTGGMVVNYLPTATTDTVAATGFVAGVASTSNPTVITTGSATFAVSDFIQISDADNVANNGVREVLSHVGNTLTIRGVGVTGTVEDFTGDDFITDTTVAGTITKINVSVLRAGTDGLWETANGSSTGLSFSNVLLTGDAAGGDLSGTYPNPTVNDGADATAIHDDTAGEIAAVPLKATPVSADLVLIEDSAAGNAKKRTTAQAIANLGTGGGATQFAQLSDSTNQNPGVTTPVAITIDTNDAIQGITHSTTVDTDEITINEDGVYEIIAQPQVGKTSGATAVTFDMFMQIDTGSGFVDVANSNVKKIIKDSALSDVLVFAEVVDLNSGDKFRLMQRTSVSTVGMGLKASAAEVGPPTIPATPSIIITVKKFGPPV